MGLLRNTPKKYLLGFGAVIILALFFVWQEIKKPALQTSLPLNTSHPSALIPNPTPSPAEIPEWQFPIADAKDRVTKKPFGLYVTPKNSPVSPEKFSGFHTGVDFETWENEQDAEVKVTAACKGAVALKKWASGYGGVLVQNCKLNNKDVTVIYGHLDLASIKQSVGDVLETGSHIGLLGKGYSEQTDKERKNLHFGIHKGLKINILGYVPNKSALNEWADPLTTIGN